MSTPQFPVPHKGILITNIVDEYGRMVIPNAIFSTETKYKMIGVGTVNSSSESGKFSEIGDGVFMGMFKNHLYLRKSFDPFVTTRAKFMTEVATINDGDNEYLSVYKRLSYDSGVGVEEKHLINFVDADSVVLMVPYQKTLPGGRLIYFFVRKGDVIYRIPMPNTYADGSFCMGTGFTCDEMPSPFTLIDKAYECLMEDKYNTDLWENQYDYLKWKPDNGRFIMERTVGSLQIILNDPITNTLLS